MRGPVNNLFLYFLFISVFFLLFSCKKTEFESILVHDTVLIQEYDTIYFRKIQIDNFIAKPISNDEIEITWETSDKEFDGCFIKVSPNEDMTDFYCGRGERSLSLHGLKHQTIYTINLYPINTKGCITDTFTCRGFLPITYDNNAWFVNNPVTAHAGGGLIDEDGHEYIYTNSKEAILNSYQKGLRVFEVDVNLTKDNIPVLVHTWSDFGKMADLEIEDNISLDLFQKSLIYGSFTPMTFDDLIDFMIEYDDVYFDLDIKVRPIAEAVRYIVETINNRFPNDAKLLLDRLIVEFYDELTYSDITHIYPFQNVFYTLGHSNSDINVIEFCVVNNIPVAGDFEWSFNAERVALFALYNINIICYNGNVDKYPACVDAKRKGIYGIQSNFVTNEIWNNL